MDSTIWDVIREQCPPAELSEVTQVLGADLIDELIELQNERQTFVNIADELAESIGIDKSLPEPPNMRDRLIKEIHFFLESLRSRKSHQTSEPSVEDADIIKYVLTETDSSRQSASSDLSDRLKSLSRASSSRTSMQTPEELSKAVSRLSSDIISPSSSHSLLSNSIDYMRDMLIDEIRQIKQDIDSLNTVLNQSVDNYTGPPSLYSLQKYGSKLEKEYYQSIDNSTSDSHNNNHNHKYKNKKNNSNDKFNSLPPINAKSITSSIDYTCHS